MDLRTLLIANAALVLLFGGVFGWRWLKQIRLAKLVDDGEITLGADIDAVREKPFAFRLGGRIHVIHPMTVSEFIEVTESLAHLDTLKVRKCTKEELMDAYAELFRRACKTVTRAMLEEMNTAQIAALLDAVIQFLVGKAHLEAEKKRPKSEGGIALGQA